MDQMDFLTRVVHEEPGVLQASGVGIIQKVGIWWKKKGLEMENVANDIWPSMH